MTGQPDGAPPPWLLTAQTITWTVDDVGYTFANGTNTTTTTAGTEGTHTYPSPPADDGMGGPTLTGHVTLGIDLNPPTIATTRTPANGAGWNNGNVTVSFTCDDAGSGIDTCTGGGTFTAETAGHDVVGTATDNVGRQTNSATVVVKIDKTKPTIAAAGPGNGAWTNGNVTVPFQCGDPGPVASGVNGGCPTGVITTEGAAQTVTETVGDKAGNTSNPATSLAYKIDKTDPAITITQPAGTFDRNQAVASNYKCTDALSGVGTCAGPVANGAAVDTSQGGTNQTFTVNATDKAGNTATKAVTFAIRPAAPELVSPADKVTTNNKRPEFRWNNSAGSQVSKYEVYVKGVKIGTVTNPAQTGQSAITPTSDLPLNTPLDWFVRAYGKDTAQSQKDSLHRTVTVDPSVPNAPTLTGGPVGPTNVTTPTFSWAGTGLTFPWKVRRVSDDVVVQQGTTAGKQVSVGPLADGSYAFEVQQAGPNNVPGDAAVLAFTVDARPPAPPVIISGPGPSTDLRTPSFAWSGEPGGTFVWTVIGGGTAVRSGGTDARSVTVAPALDPGAWVFIVQQVDGAGNTSAPSAGYFFTITPPPAPSTLPTAVAATALPTTITAKNAKRAASVLTPKTLNAKFLLPKAGAKLRTLTPVLSWKKRPKGVKIYNLQIFLNNKKILSRFPTGQSFKVPKGVLKPGKQYLWRVWPFFGHYPKDPLGLSYFATLAVKPAVKAAPKK